MLYKPESTPFDSIWWMTYIIKYINTPCAGPVYKRDVKFVIIVSANVIAPNNETVFVRFFRIHWTHVTRCDIWCPNEVLSHGRRDIAKWRMLLTKHIHVLFLPRFPADTLMCHSWLTWFRNSQLSMETFYALYQCVCNLYGCIWRDSYMIHQVACNMLLQCHPVCWF